MEPNYSNSQKHKIGEINLKTRVYYIDYEGFIDKRPSIVGIWKDSVFKQYTFEDILSNLADDLNVTFITWDKWIQLLKQYQMEGYLAIGYTMHEAEKTIELGPAEYWYRNAHWFLKRHVNWTSIGRPKYWSLEYVAKHLGFELKHYGSRQATQRIGYALKFAAKYGNFQKFTPTAKAKWTKLLRYNKQDVDSLRFVTEAGIALGNKRTLQ